MTPSDRPPPKTLAFPVPAGFSAEGSGAGVPLSEHDLLPLLRERWARARAGRGAFLHVEGRPGSGRTSLLGRLAHAVAGEDAFVVSLSAMDEHHQAVRDQVHLEAYIVRIAEGMRAMEATTGRSPLGPGAGDVVPWLLPGADFLQAATGIAALPAAADPDRPSRARVHAELLLDVATEHPVLLLIDDAHRGDPSARRILEAVATGLKTREACRLLVVATSASALIPDAGGATDPPRDWAEVPGETVALPPVEPETLVERLAAHLLRFGEPDLGWLAEVAHAAGGHPRLAMAFLAASERAGAFKRAERGRVFDPDWTRRPGHAGRRALAEGRLPPMAANVRADLQAAAVLGGPFEIPQLAHLWDVPAEAARQRVLAFEETGLVEPAGIDGQRFAFLGAEWARQLAEGLPEAMRTSVQVRLALYLRAGTRALPGSEEARRPGLDVTETWSESRRRDHRTREELDRLATAARLFTRAQRHAEAAEAAVTLVERLFETGGNPFVLAGRWGRREDRERRIHIHTTLAEATRQLEVARQTRSEPTPDADLLSVNVRITAARARYKEAMGDFTEARRLVGAAVEMASHSPEARLRLHVLKTQLEVHYAGGDHNGGRDALVRLLAELVRVPTADSARIHGWLAEALSRWEWAGLHERLFPHLIDQIRAAGDGRGVVRARLERLVAAPDVDGQPPQLLLDAAVEDARQLRELPYAAERLSLHAAEMMQALIDSHHDALSGEFYPPDLFGENTAPGTPTVLDRFEWPVRLMEQADDLAREADHRIARLRVLTTMLGVVYEVRERAGDLLDRWMGEYADQRPIRLLELLELVGHGFFSAEHLEAITERTILLAQNLGLDQVLADTLYEALDRELPGVVRRAEVFFGHARQAYERVGDAYGLVTLLLVQSRLIEGGRPGDARRLLDEAADIAEARAAELTPDQQAFIAFRLGELMQRADADAETVSQQLERAIELYDRGGDVEHVQVVGDLLRDLYKKSGDFGRYRLLRERFRALETRAPGVDPLGLELRIEHLLSLARQEQDEERAIEMVERCVRLFARMPDSTTRIDECFVEISKICRRRADEAQTDEGFQAWLRRSLDAVRVASGINRNLGNYNRVFEEMHELFDDLLSMGALDEYLAARAECRELAFGVGQVPELLSLFDEHLQYDPDAGFDLERLPEVRGFFEALVRYLRGLGARAEAVHLERSFVAFLTALGETELAEHYRLRTPDAEV